ncbi:MAG: excinuclease ABC subunit A [Francisellaceae bacterium]|jgi:excinuclease ABC subunit A
MDKIIIKGAKTHNLKNISLEIPRNKLTVITGLSGSGKSSLAFDTLYAEGQRRYVESLSAYARQFLSLMEKPDVEHIAGLSPAISIEQKSTSHNPRSTVGTVTEIYDYLRVLYARAGEAKCPTHNTTLRAQTVSQMVDQVLEIEEDAKLAILAAVVVERKGEHIQLMEKLYSEGFLRARINGVIYELDQPPELERYKKHTIEVVVDRFKVKKDHQQRLSESFETALDLSNGLAKVHFLDDDTKEDLLFSSSHACPKCNFSLHELSPRIFSFNNPAGACEKCQGIGFLSKFDEDKLIMDQSFSLSEGAISSWERRNNYYYHQLEAIAKHYDFDLKTPYQELPDNIQTIIMYGSGDIDIQMFYKSPNGHITERIKPFEGVIPHLERRYRETDSSLIQDELAKLMSRKPCTVCKGSRLNEGARNVLIQDKTLPEFTSLSIDNALDWLAKLKLSGQQLFIAEGLLTEIQSRLGFLANVGLGYLTLFRQADTLSGGEAQRIRLASQIGAGLVGVMYILDEPSIGLHQRDNQKLLDTLFHLRDIGNTVIVVEHDEEAIRQADHVIDIGPGAGIHGGEIIADGTIEDIINCKNSITGDYLSGRKEIAIPKQRLSPSDQFISIKNATGNNLKGVDLNIPIGLLTCVTGVSGSGKSTLINRTLYPLAARILNRNTTLSPESHESYSGFEHVDKVIDIDQSPIGRTPRSNPATYTGIFTPIRELFAQTPDARTRGYKAGRFSFNVKGGRCEACQGDGLIKVEMHFLADVYVPCDICSGKRYNRETLEIRYKGKNIHEVLAMSVEEAVVFFEPIPQIHKRIKTLIDVGLSYITLGQNATTLSGGEAQRVKLSKELSKPATGKTLYIMDEPTTGLHFHDIKQLLEVITTLRDHGNTVVIIEHNLDVIKIADWIIDLGPEGGDNGGQLIAEGSPESITKITKSYTGQFIKSLI